MLKAISNAAVAMVSESPTKASRTLHKEREKVVNRIIAIASVNTCKHRLEKVLNKTINISKQIYSLNFILSSRFAYNNHKWCITYLVKLSSLCYSKCQRLKPIK